MPKSVFLSVNWGLAVGFTINAVIGAGACSRRKIRVRFAWCGASRTSPPTNANIAFFFVEKDILRFYL